MNEVNLYMPLIRALIQAGCGVLAGYGLMSGSLVEPFTALAVSTFTILWMLKVQNTKNKKIEEVEDA